MTRLVPPWYPFPPIGGGNWVPVIGMSGTQSGYQWEPVA